MIRSMMSGVAGLRTHATRMDVISNDVANVNTVGFKQSDVTFKETFINTMRAPSTGTPPMQIGLGVDVGEIVRNWSDGVLMQTGQASNMAIAGNGLFFVKDPGGVREYFSRAGDFILDCNGTNTYLINSTGKRLLGSVTPPTGAVWAPGVLQEIDLQSANPGVQVSSFSIGADGGITVNSVDGTTVNNAWYIPVATFDNNLGLQSIGMNLYLQTTASGDPLIQLAGSTGVGTVYQGYLENSNVDLSAEFTEMILTQRGFEANSRSITTSDQMLQELLALKR